MNRFRFCCAFVLLTTLSYGAAPTLTALNPPGAQVGSTNTVTCLGKVGAWPAKLWCSHPGIRFVADAKKKGRFAVSVSNDVPVGPYLVRLHDKDGASAAALFVAGGLPELNEKEDNGMLARGNAITNFPVTINGLLAKSGDTDFFRVHLKRGQTLTASLVAYGLRSLIDPFLHIYDPRGFEAAVASDSQNLDPVLNYTAREDGTHTLQVFAVGHKASSSVRFSGRSDAVYRMTLKLDDGAISPPVADQSESRKDDETQVLKVPCSVAGKLSTRGEIDRYQFAAKKGEQFRVRVQSHQLGYPLDPVLVINRPGGKLLRETDDTKPYRDPEYLVKASEGDYTVEIRDRFGRGGDDCHYRLMLEKPEPNVEVTMDSEIVSFEAGKKTEIKLKLNRLYGHTAKLRAVLNDLPDGVSIVEDKIEAKSKTATLKYLTATNAPISSAPFRILIIEDGKEGNKIRRVERSFVTGDSRGDYLLNGTEWFWLTVKELSKKEAKK